MASLSYFSAELITIKRVLLPRYLESAIFHVRVPRFATIVDFHISYSMYLSDNKIMLVAAPCTCLTPIERSSPLRRILIRGHTAASRQQGLGGKRSSCVARMSSHKDYLTLCHTMTVAAVFLELRVNRLLTAEVREWMSTVSPHMPCSSFTDPADRGWRHNTSNWVYLMAWVICDLFVYPTSSAILRYVPSSMTPSSHVLWTAKRRTAYAPFSGFWGKCP